MASHGRVRPTAVIICDDIRREHNGKELLIGVYAGDIIIGQAPATMLVSLHIILEVEQAGELSFRVKLHTDEDVGEVDGLLQVAGDHSEGKAMAISLTGLPIHISGPGRLSILTRQGDEDWVLLRRTDIRIGDAFPAVTPVPNLGPHREPAKPA